jgi:transketolase
MREKNTTDLLIYGAYRIALLSLRATTKAGSGHLTSSLSSAEIMSMLFLSALGRQDRFILSKGHAAPILYAIYHELGLISYDELMSLRQSGSPLEGHPSSRWSPVRVATGSLGQGLAIGLGYLTAIDDPTARMVVLLGDTELTEGSNWEAAFCAAYAQEHRLIAIIDANGLGQSHRAPLDPDSIASRFKAWGWQTEIVDGHAVEALSEAFARARTAERPACIVARTCKGHGIVDIEDQDGWHGKVASPSHEKRYEQELAAAYGIFANEPLSYRALCIERSAQYRDWWPQAAHYTQQLRTLAYAAPYAPRKAVGEALAVYGADTNIFVLDAEVKNSTYTELFEAAYPDRFVETFIAEQAMIGIASGIAAAGKIVVAATFAAFLTRAHDQIRMAGISRLPLRLIGTHVGVSVGEDGPSQMGLEDIALFRTVPESVILQPADAVAADRLIAQMLAHTSAISYLRAVREALPILYSADTVFTLGGAHILRESSADTVLIVATGVTVHEALNASALLAQQGISARVIDCYSIQPLPLNLLNESLIATGGRIIVAEDHYAAGGLGEAIACSCVGRITQFAHCAVPGVPMSGPPAELRAWAGIDAAAIVRAASRFFD